MNPYAPAFVPAAGNGNGNQLVPAAGDGNGNQLVPAAGDVNGNQLVPAAGDGNGNPVVPAAGDGNGNLLLPAAAYVSLSSYNSLFRGDGDDVASITDVLAPIMAVPAPGPVEDYNAIDWNLSTTRRLRATHVSSSTIPTPRQNAPLVPGSRDVYISPFYPRQDHGGRPFSMTAGLAAPPFSAPVAVLDFASSSTSAPYRQVFYYPPPLYAGQDNAASVPTGLGAPGYSAPHAVGAPGYPAPHAVGAPRYPAPVGLGAPGYLAPYLAPVNLGAQHFSTTAGFGAPGYPAPVGLGAQPSSMTAGFGAPPLSAPAQGPSTEAKQGDKKTVLCTHHPKGQCEMGMHCWFAHGVHELRDVYVPREYRTKDCKFGEQCPYKERCFYKHPQGFIEQQDPDVDAE